jgi:hypothetical protein
VDAESALCPLPGLHHGQYLRGSEYVGLVSKAEVKSTDNAGQSSIEWNAWDERNEVIFLRICRGRHILDNMNLPSQIPAVRLFRCIQYFGTS